MTKLTITERAMAALRQFRAAHGGKPVRLSINPGGCSGFDIVFSASTPQTEDIGFGPDDSLLIDPVSLGLITGATVDYADSIGKEGFVVENIPNMESRCGCGKSFSIS